MGANLSESRALAEAEARLNRINQVTPTGSLTFDGPRDAAGRLDPFNTTATTTLSPAQQRLLEQQQMAQRLAGRGGIDLLRSLPQAGQPVLSGTTDPLRSFGPAAEAGRQNPFNLQTMMGANTDFSAERSRVEQAQFDRAMSLLNPELQRSEEALRQRMANQGLPQSSAAFTSELGRFEDTSNRAREQAALAAVLAGGQEQSRMLADLLGTSQVGIGQASNLRDQLFGQALDTRNLRNTESLIERQLPLSDMMSLFSLQQPVSAGDLFSPPATQVQSLATPGSMPFGQQLLLGAVGALGSAGGGYLAGR